MTSEPNSNLGISPILSQKEGDSVPSNDYQVLANKIPELGSAHQEGLNDKSNIESRLVSKNKELEAIDQKLDALQKEQTRTELRCTQLELANDQQKASFQDREEKLKEQLQNKDNEITELKQQLEAREVDKQTIAELQAQLALQMLQRGAVLGASSRNTPLRTFVAQKRGRPPKRSRKGSVPAKLEKRSRKRCSKAVEYFDDPTVFKRKKKGQRKKKTARTD
jgi:hypothetical protein